jgi:hypothetical protein
MKSTDINVAIIEGYLQLLDNLSPRSKLDLISGLTHSVKSDIADKKNSFKKAFGAFQSKKTADQLIEEIRNSRSFNREIVPI